MAGTKFYMKMTQNLENLWKQKLLLTIVEQVTLSGSMVSEKKNRGKNNPLCSIVSLVNSDFSLFFYT